MNRRRSGYREERRPPSCPTCIQATAFMDGFNPDATQDHQDLAIEIAIWALRHLEQHARQDFDPPAPF